MKGKFKMTIRFCSNIKLLSLRQGKLYQIKRKSRSIVYCRVSISSIILIMKLEQ